MLGIKGKSNKTEVENIDLMGMTYTEFVSQELNNKMNELTTAKKRIESGINEALADIKKRGNLPDNGLVAIVGELREKETLKQKEIEQARREYEVDFSLLCTAHALDRVDSDNKGMDLIYEAGSKVNEIISMFSQIEKYYGGEYGAPSAYTMLKRSIEGLVMIMNNELPKMQKVNKAALLQKFNERMKIVEANKIESKANKDKYIL